MTNICDGIESSLKLGLLNLNSLESKIQSSLNNLENSIDLIILGMSGPLNDVNDLLNTIDDTKKDALAEINDVSNSLSFFTGSCLDGVVNALNDLTNNTADFLTNLFPTPITPEINILNYLSKYKDFLDKLGIEKLIMFLDELLGCLSSADCLSLNVLDDYNLVINNFITTCKLNIDGSFTVDNYISAYQNFPTGLDDVVNALGPSLENVKAEVTNVATSVKNTVSSALGPKSTLY